MESNSCSDMITVSVSEWQRVCNISEQRRLAMCDVLEVLEALFGDTGIPTSKAVLVKRITGMLMRSDELEQKLSKFSEENIKRYINLAKKQ